MPPTSGVVAVTAGQWQALALMNDGTVQAWGLDGAWGTDVPSGLSNVILRSHVVGNLTLLSAEMAGSRLRVRIITERLTCPLDYPGVEAISGKAGARLALLTNGTVVAWGDGVDGDTDIPVGLTNVVAVAAGAYHNLALLSNGHVVAWGLNDLGQTNVPAGLSNVMAIAAGDYHSVALKNDGNLVAWGDNSSGRQTCLENCRPIVTGSGGSPRTRTPIRPSSSN